MTQSPEQVSGVVFIQKHSLESSVLLYGELNKLSLSGPLLPFLKDMFSYKLPVTLRAQWYRRLAPEFLTLYTLYLKEAAKGQLDSSASERPYCEKEFLIPFYLLGTAPLKGSKKNTSARRHGTLALTMTVLAKEQQRKDYIH